MIIPIRCFTCGSILADKYLYFQDKIKDTKQIDYFTETNTKQNKKGKVMDELGLIKYCCRRHFMSHVDIHP